MQTRESEPQKETAQLFAAERRDLAAGKLGSGSAGGLLDGAQGVLRGD